MPDRAKVAVLISGGGTNMAALLYASRAADCPYEIVLVASNNPDAAGLVLARAEGVPTWSLDHRGMAREAHEKNVDAALRKSGAEFVALAGYMRILTPGFVAGWAGRIINVHPSLLPKYPGLHTHQRALEAGNAKAGVTVHLVTGELDDGPHLGQTEVAILPGDTADSLAARVLIAEHQLYPRCLAELTSRPQRADWLQGKVDALATAIPEVERRESHGSPGWHSGGKNGKFFAYFADRHHGEPHIALLVKTSGQDEMTSLIEQASDIYFRPAYYGASGWVGIVLNRPGVDWDHIAGWLERSWRMVAPKRLTRLLDAADNF